GFTCSLAGPSAKTDCGPYTALADGDYTLTVDATDLAGNAATPAVATWTVDTAAPVLVVSGLPADGSTVQAASESFSVTQPAEVNKGTITCSLTGPVTSSSCSSFS